MNKQHRRFRRSPAAGDLRPPLLRAGLTLIDLLVSICVMVWLASLFLPAVGAVREAARRMQCKNNLAQLGCALQNYTLAHGTFPPGTVNPTGPITNQASPKEYHVSWTVQILPYLELSSVYNHFDFAHGVYDLCNFAPQERTIPMLICPSALNLKTTRAVGISHYAGVHNSQIGPIDEDNDGILHLNSRVRPGDVTDGLSNTLLVGEKMSVAPIWGWSSGTNDTLRNTGRSRQISQYFEDSEEKYRRYLKRAGLDKLDPNQITGNFASSHAGGMQYVLADGSVRFVSVNLGGPVQRALATYRGGEMPSEF